MSLERLDCFSNEPTSPLRNRPRAALYTRRAAPCTTLKIYRDGTVTVLEALPVRLIEPAEMAERINTAPNKPLEVIMHLGIAVRATMNH